MAPSRLASHRRMKGAKEEDKQSVYRERQRDLELNVDFFHASVRPLPGVDAAAPSAWRAAVSTCRLLSLKQGVRREVGVRRECGFYFNQGSTEGGRGVENIKDTHKAFCVYYCVLAGRRNARSHSHVLHFICVFSITAAVAAARKTEASTHARRGGWQREKERDRERAGVNERLAVFSEEPPCPPSRFARCASSRQAGISGSCVFRIILEKREGAKQNQTRKTLFDTPETRSSRFKNTCFYLPFYQLCPLSHPLW